MSLKDDLILGLDNAHHLMQGVVQLIDEDQEIYPGWTIWHLVAHLTGWDEALLDSIRAYRSDQPIHLSAPIDSDDYNARSIEARRDLSYAQVLDEWETMREDLKIEMSAMQDAEFTTVIGSVWGETATIFNLIFVISDHERDHAIEISRMLKPKT